MPFHSRWHGIGFQSGVVHGNTQIIHHGVVALGGTGHRFQSGFRIDTHDGCQVSSALHGLGGHLKGLLLG